MKYLGGGSPVGVCVCDGPSVGRLAAQLPLALHIIDVPTAGDRPFPLSDSPPNSRCRVSCLYYILYIKPFGHTKVE